MSMVEGQEEIAHLLGRSLDQSNAPPPSVRAAMLVTVNNRNFEDRMPKAYQAFLESPRCEILVFAADQLCEAGQRQIERLNRDHFEHPVHLWLGEGDELSFVGRAKERYPGARLEVFNVLAA